MPCRAGDLFEHMVGAFLVIRKIAVQKIGKKEKLENCKHDKKFDQNYLPQGFPEGHPAKTIPIEMIDV